MNKRLLHFFSIGLVLCTFVLIFSGGLVTSKGAGMTVPDWPTSYGYNMFMFPVSRWVGGIWFEHVHRIIASVVGFLTLILCVWIANVDRRPWMKWLGLVAVVGVILQGVLGGLRVVWHMDHLGIFHGCLAQSFLLLCASLALFTSPWWARADLRQDPVRHFAPAFIFLTALIFCQLAIAASMRHAHAGLSIPDFPLAYGRVLPPLDAASIERINVERYAATQPATSAVLIGLQFLHRLVAYFLGVAIPWLAWRVFRVGGVLRPWGMVWSGLVLVQITLGAYTIWSNKAADVATAHVAVGAVLFVMGGLMSIVALRARHDFARGHAAGVAKPAVMVEAEV